MRNGALSLLTLFLMMLAGEAAAIKPPVRSRRDARRQIRAAGASVSDPVQAGRDSAVPPDDESARKFGDFNRANGGRWKIRFNPRTGAPEALVEGEARPRLYGAQSAQQTLQSPESLANAFISENAALLKMDPAQLEIETISRGGDHSHVLYRQVYRGVPVEFSRVKVHVGPDGAVMGANSKYEPGLTLDTTPAIPAPTAADAVLRDGGVAPSEGKLVVFPDEQAGRVRLAWKFTARGRYALWRYYVDAKDGDIIFRYNDMRYQVCNTSGTVQAQVFDVDPSTTPGPVTRAMRHASVYVGGGSTFAVTNAQGFYCHADQGKIMTSMQGPYVRLANFMGRNAHYDNGSGVWATRVTPVSSPHPYADGAVNTQTVDISLVQPNAVKVVPVFSAFEVGRFDDSFDIGDDDQLAILDGAGKPVASYVGNRGPFNGASVPGAKYSLRLKSNPAGTAYGYDVSVTSYLALTSPSTWGLPHSSVTWQAAMTASGGSAELSAFYHLNLMHDYFMAGPNASSAAYINQPVVASVYVGPNFNGAFYNPDHDNLNFGDITVASPQDVLVDDATVPRHEYTHYVVEKIWSIQNYGQAGAISEAMADYFAGSSLNLSSIGKFYNISQGGSVPLRELDCVGTPESCWQLGGNRNWSGEIHDDSIFLSQAFWDIRRDRIATLGFTNGKKCADNLVFQALLFFPESFSEYYDALKRVDAAGLAANCGGPNTAQAIINTAFATHGLIPPVSDAFEGSRGNNGFETAVDVTTFTTVSATISPAADLDFYSFAAGAGPLQLTLRLPADGSFFKAYNVLLFDRQHGNTAPAAIYRNATAQADPPYDGFDTVAGFCESHNCTTSASNVVLTYNVTNPGLYYVMIAGGQAISGSNSGVNSLTPYSLELSYNKAGALNSSVVSAQFDQDQISFTVNVTSFVRTQNYNFAHAQLRDHAGQILQNSDTGMTGSYLSLVSSVNALGKITGSVRLQPGFAQRYPAVGTVHLEVFGYNVDPDNVRVSTVSLGLSNPLNLTTDRTELRAFNNVFNPARGGKAVVKYEVQSAGRVTLRLYTLAGQHVATLLDAEVPAGKGSVDWSGRNVAGTTVASGIYVLHAKGPGLDKQQKIVVVK